MHPTLSASVCPILQNPESLQRILSRSSHNQYLSLSMHYIYIWNIKVLKKNNNLFKTAQAWSSERPLTSRFTFRTHSELCSPWVTDGYWMSIKGLGALLSEQEQGNCLLECLFWNRVDALLFDDSVSPPAVLRKLAPSHLLHHPGEGGAARNADSWLLSDGPNLDFCMQSSGIYCGLMQTPLCSVSLSLRSTAPRGIEPGNGTQHSKPNRMCFYLQDYLVGFAGDIYETHICV